MDLRTISMSFAVMLPLVGCGDASHPEREVSDELAAACGSLCTAQEPCDTIGWTPDECADACEADVGTPGADCTAAIETWADCLEAECSETACVDERSGRDAACGGTG